jgi:hypothetical protein
LEGSWAGEGGDETGGALGTEGVRFFQRKPKRIAVMGKEIIKWIRD